MTDDITRRRAEVQRRAEVAKMVAVLRELYELNPITYDEMLSLIEDALAAARTRDAAGGAQP